MKAVRNERVKLFAGALDRLSTQMVTVGTIAPIAAVLYGFSAPVAGLPFPTLAVGALAWLGAGCVLHALAQLTLGRIRE